LFAALDSRQIKFSDDLFFFEHDHEVKKLKEADIEVFREFKKQSRKGLYAPVEVVHDPEQGYKVKAVKFIKRFTLLCEYTGEVVDMEGNENVEKSDALMEFYTTPQSILVIYPDQVGNLARFISGINNEKGKRNQNVKSMKCDIDGSIHIILYTTRNVHPGETLYYNYNEGALDEKETKEFVVEEKTKKKAQKKKLK